MKKALALIFALLLLLPSLAFADVIVEPENAFYRTHQSECKHQEGRTYLANGPDGTLDLYTAPNGVVSATLNNGDAFYCQWVYTDKEGNVWGFSEHHSAWAPLGYTLVQYDHISFEEDHKADITEGNTETVEYAAVCLYEYPGASSCPIRLESVGLAPEKLYTDEAGRRWGSVSYIYGIRNRWFCLDDPANETIPGEQRSPAPSGYAAPTSLPSASRTGVILGVTGGVALVTLIVVLVLFRRKRKA